MAAINRTHPTAFTGIHCATLLPQLALLASLVYFVRLVSAGQGRRLSDATQLGKIDDQPHASSGRY